MHGVSVIPEHAQTYRAAQCAVRSPLSLGETIWLCCRDILHSRHWPLQIYTSVTHNAFYKCVAHHMYRKTQGYLYSKGCGDVMKVDGATITLLSWDHTLLEGAVRSREVISQFSVFWHCHVKTYEQQRADHNISFSECPTTWGGGMFFTKSSLLVTILTSTHIRTSTHEC